MVVSLVGPVRYGVIYLNGESCSGRSLGSCPKRRKRAWLCGEGDFRQTERELSPSFKLYDIFCRKIQKLVKLVNNGKKCPKQQLR